MNHCEKECYSHQLKNTPKSQAISMEMKEEDASSTAQIYLPLKVQCIVVFLKMQLDLPWLAKHALKAQDPLSAPQLLPLHLLSALNLVHTPKVSQTRN